MKFHTRNQALPGGCAAKDKDAAHRVVAQVLALVGMLGLALAGSFATVVPAQASTRHVIDDVDYLSAAVENTLEQSIIDTSTFYQQDIVVLFTRIGSEEPMVVADDYFDYNGYGLGAERSGVLLLVALDTRDWWISTRGDSIATFTDADIQRIGEDVRQELSAGDWSGGARVFVERCGDEMKKATGKSMPMTKDEIRSAAFVVVTLGLFGGIGCTSVVVQRFFVRKMKNEGSEVVAASYLIPGSLNITNSQDVLKDRQMARMARPKQTSSSSVSFSGGGGSSTHISSSGATHGGGGGKF